MWNSWYLCTYEFKFQWCFSFLLLFILFYISFLFCFLRILFWNTENVLTAFSLELLVWFNRYFRKTTVINSFCAWLGTYYMQNPVLCSSVENLCLLLKSCSLQLPCWPLKTINQHWLSSVPQSTVFSVWKWYLEELTLKFLSLIFIHRPCLVLMYLFD